MLSKAPVASNASDDENGSDVEYEREVLTDSSEEEPDSDSERGSGDDGGCARRREVPWSAYTPPPTIPDAPIGQEGPSFTPQPIPDVAAQKEWTRDLDRVLLVVLELRGGWPDARRQQSGTARAKRRSRDCT